jgi:hypothetical protein
MRGRIRGVVSNASIESIVAFHFAIRKPLPALSGSDISGRAQRMMPYSKELLLLSLVRERQRIFPRRSAVLRASSIGSHSASDLLIVSCHLL